MLVERFGDGPRRRFIELSDKIDELKRAKKAVSGRGAAAREQKAALDKQEVDPAGLDKNDRRYLECLIDVFAGGPTGVEALAATMNITSDTLSDEIEPYLLREQFITRTPRGRMATAKAFSILNRSQPKPKDDRNAGLFE